MARRERRRIWLASLIGRVALAVATVGPKPCLASSLVSEHLL
jgi:hypothetical protein